MPAFSSGNWSYFPEQSERCARVKRGGERGYRRANVGGHEALAARPEAWRLVSISVPSAACHYRESVAAATTSPSRSGNVYNAPKIGALISIKSTA